MKKREERERVEKNVFRIHIHRNIQMMEVIKLFSSCSSLRYYQLLLTMDMEDGSKMMRQLNEKDIYIHIIPPIVRKNCC